MDEMTVSCVCGAAEEGVVLQRSVAAELVYEGECTRCDRKLRLFIQTVSPEQPAEPDEQPDIPT